MANFFLKLVLVLAVVFLVGCGIVRFSLWLGQVVVKAETGRVEQALKQAGE